MRRLMGVVATGLIASLAIADQETENLRKEFEAYRVATDARIAQLETNSIEVTTGYTIDQLLNSLEYAGYFRAGLGVDEHGDSMEAFKAPNAGAKYRLGNEAETYIESTFKKNFLSQKLLNDNVDFFTVLTFAYVTPTANNNNFDSTLSIREAYAGARGVWKSQPDALFWAGNRFYQHLSVHINDFFFRDMAGFGGGVDDIAIGSAKFAIAWLGGSIDELQSDGTAYRNDYHFNKNTIDIRIYDIDSGFGKLDMSADIADFGGDTLAIGDSGDNNIDVKSSSGWALGAMLTSEITKGLVNRATIQYGTGPAENFKAIITAPQGVTPPESGGLVINTEDASRLRLTDDIVIENASPLSMQGVVVYEHYDNGMDTRNTIDWFSIGARPIYHFNDYFGLAFEGGVDYTNQKDGPDGTLTKLTIAPLIQPGRAFFDRPVIRLFATYAFWNGDDGFEEAVAPVSHASDTDGMSFGVQMEAWW